MAFFCQRDEDNLFTCRSSFTPYVPPVEKISIQDHIPQIVKDERKKDKGFEYLPGQRLLIELNKKAKKAKKKKGDRMKPEDIDVERVSKSLGRVLKFA
jgi:hypothetical protein